LDRSGKKSIFARSYKKENSNLMDRKEEINGMQTEHHPFEPFMPASAKVLMLGTFPPAPHRWSMKFYYPNYQNDMWRIFGLIFFNDKSYFLVESEKRFDLDAIKTFLCEKGIALYDTATDIVRTKNTASDKDLLIVRETEIDALLAQLPECKAIVTAGQLATSIVANRYGVAVPKVGEYVEFSVNGRPFRLYRMPSSSRAYPMRPERKADYYRLVFDYVKNSPVEARASADVKR